MGSDKPKLMLLKAEQYPVASMSSMSTLAAESESVHKHRRRYAHALQRRYATETFGDTLVVVIEPVYCGADCDPKQHNKRVF